jgi:uncharacterized membrane protein
MKPAKFLGHHIHPMLIVFPLGLLGMAVVFDIIYLVRADAGFAAIAYWNIAGGVIGGLLAAVFGFWDWLGIAAGTRAKAIGLWHGLTNVVVVVLFSWSWTIRRADPMYIPDGLALTLSFLALGLALVAGWLGGELVERLGIGVDPGAGPNAPSSLRVKRADVTP